ncbi:MAG TPA: hypothetical protein VHS31_03600 [Tepidisphaeraceae bacterium]|jgi:hypothetical protein|nr:hypothetical protein [Tepidisphaeraceae bacterium]
MYAKLTNWMKCLAITAATLFAASSAHAGFTTIGAHPAGEADQEQVFAHQFGGIWQQQGVNFTDGSITATRINDSLSASTVLNLNKGKTGSSTDDLWSGDKFTVSAVAKFSGYTQSIGILDSTGSHNLLDIQGTGFNVTSANITVDMHGQQFQWQRAGDSGTQLSLAGNNLDLRDHMLTYEVEGLPNTTGPVWMLFFEDMNLASDTPIHRTSADFNDLVVEIRPVVTPIPLRPGGWAGLWTLTGAALVRGRRVLSKVSMA